MRASDVLAKLKQGRGEWSKRALGKGPVSLEGGRNNSVNKVAGKSQMTSTEGGGEKKLSKPSKTNCMEKRRKSRSPRGRKAVRCETAQREGRFKIQMTVLGKRVGGSGGNTGTYSGSKIEGNERERERNWNGYYQKGGEKSNIWKMV